MPRQFFHEKKKKTWGTYENNFIYIFIKFFALKSHKRGIEAKSY